MVQLHALSEMTIVPQQRAPVTLNLPKHLHPGVVLRTVFVCDDTCKDNLEICLQDENRKNVALLLRYYFRHNHWALNSEIDEEWGVEEIKTSFHLRPTHTYTATVRVHEDSYIIHINNVFVTNYRHRLEYRLLTKLSIMGPVYIKYVAYEDPPTKTPLRVMLGVLPEQEEVNAKQGVLRDLTSDVTATEARLPVPELSIPRMGVTPGRINVLSPESENELTLTSTSGWQPPAKTETVAENKNAKPTNTNRESQDLSGKQIKSALKVSQSQVRIAPETSVSSASRTRSVLKTALSERTLTQSRVNLTEPVPNENTAEEPTDLDRSQMKKSVTFLGVASGTDSDMSTEMFSTMPESAITRATSEQTVLSESSSKTYAYASQRPLEITASVPGLSSKPDDSRAASEQNRKTSSDKRCEVM